MQNNRCFNCKWYSGKLKCIAFDKIPNEILLGKNNHSKQLPNQGNNIVFEEI